MHHTTIEIKGFPTEVEIVKKQGARYYNAAYMSAIPKAIKDSIGILYRFDKGILCDNAGNKVVSNPKEVGKPYNWPINGNSFITGTMSKKLRELIFRKMKEYIRPFVKPIKPLPHVPLVVWMEYHFPIKNKWDLDNHTWLWFKWFQDCLQDQAKIENDDAMNIRATGLVVLVPAKMSERKIVFHIQSLEGSYVSWDSIIAGSKAWTGKTPESVVLKICHP